MPKHMTRKQMERAAFSWHFNLTFGSEFPEDKIMDQCEFLSPGECICASLLMSEAHRPRGHNGDWKDD